MLIKTSELIDSALDYAVAKCEGHQVGVTTADEGWLRFINGASLEELLKHADAFAKVKASFKAALCKIHSDGYKSEADARGWNYSTSWAQGGPIIERERLQLTTDKEWVASTPKAVEIGGYRKYCFATGSTPLIAAMRCYVASKLGEAVEIPEELLDLK